MNSNKRELILIQREINQITQPNKLYMNMDKEKLNKARRN